MKKLLLSDRICLAVATLFGIGYVPLIPGTAASLVAVIIFLVIKSNLWFFIITVSSLIFAFSLSGDAEKIFKQKDSKKIVIDDFSGMLITFLFIPHDIRFIVCGFFLFRMLDVLKIPPANIIEKYKGSLGVVGDDVVAGIYANIFLQLARVLL